MLYNPIDNKYYKWYNNIIYLAKLRNWSKNDIDQYCEIHHIIPKSLGGSNSQQNLVLLTAKEHFIVHKLLTKFLTGQAQYKMIYAYQLMFSLGSKIQFRYYNSKEHQKAKNMLKTLTGPKHHAWNKPQSIEQRRKNSESNMGERNHFYGKTHSKETKAKLKIAATGVKQSETTIAKKIQRVSKFYHIKDLTNNIDYGIIQNLKQWCRTNQLTYACMCDILNSRQKYHRQIEWSILPK